MYALPLSVDSVVTGRFAVHDEYESHVGLARYLELVRQAAGRSVSAQAKSCTRWFYIRSRMCYHFSLGNARRPVCVRCMRCGKRS
jgi:hypothetical protein